MSMNYFYLNIMKKAFNLININNLISFRRSNTEKMSFRENSNRIPLGKPASGKPSSSLLKPSYLRGTEGSNSSDDYEAFTNYYSNYSNPPATSVSNAVANITSSLKRDISRSSRPEEESNKGSI
jgi:hypothetical protein